MQSEAKSLATNDIGDYEFLVVIIIWFDILCAVNVVSKHLQSRNMLIDVALEKIKGLISFFQQYRETGFKEYCTEMNINPLFPEGVELKGIFLWEFR